MWMKLAALFFLSIIRSIAADDVNNVFSDPGRALIPPRGWNSFDSYSWSVSEEDFLENAELVSKYLRNFGYQYVVVDNLWFRKLEAGVSSFTSGTDTLDAYGRPLPDPDRWPSSQNGQGFKQVSDRVHQLGLKFGISVIRGIHKSAVELNTPVYGSQGSRSPYKWKARDIAVVGQDCSFMPESFMGVNVSSYGGRLYLKSLYRQYADWGVDFIGCRMWFRPAFDFEELTVVCAVKHDCTFGERDLHLEELLAVSEAVLHSGRQIILSVAPGENATPVMAAAVANVTNMFRVSPHILDTWVELEPAFNIARDFAASGLVGGSGLGGGRSWPDLDVLPFGWLTDDATGTGPYRSSRLTDSEMKTQMTLWGMARSPLMFGGDMRHLDQTTLDVLTNPTVLEINSNSFGNTEILRFATDTIKVAECGGFVNHTRWSTDDDLSQICWRGHNNSRGCYKWTPHVHKGAIESSSAGRVSDTSDACLDAKGTLVNNRSEHFTVCRDHPTQSWKLTPTGDLVNEHLGKCAISVREDDLTRIWVSYGHSGEVYVAFFNASPRKTEMSITLEELLDEFYTTLAVANSSSVIFSPHNKTRWRCLGEEVWSGKKVEETRSISFKVDGHGCALFVLSCNYNLRGRNLKTLSRVLLASFIGIVIILTLVNLVRYCWLSKHKPHKITNNQNVKQ